MGDGGTTLTISDMKTSLVGGHSTNQSSSSRLAQLPLSSGPGPRAEAICMPILLTRFSTNESGSSKPKLSISRSRIYWLARAWMTLSLDPRGILIPFGHGLLLTLLPMRRRSPGNPLFHSRGLAHPDRFTCPGGIILLHG